MTQRSTINVTVFCALLAATLGASGWILYLLYDMSDFRRFLPWFLVLGALLLCLLTAEAGNVRARFIGAGGPSAPLLPSASGTAIRTFILFVIALMFFVPTVYKFALDEAQWLLMARNVVEGYGLVDVSGNHSLYRIGYVLYYALGYLVAGVTGAALSPFIALALFTALLFLVAQRLYGQPTAMLAAALYILMPRQRYLTAQLIDGTCAAGVLVAFLLVTSEQRQREFQLGLVAGLASFIAFLMKEVAIFILPLPLLLAVARCNFGTRQRIAGFYLSATTLFGLYCLAVVSTTVDPYFRSDDLSLQQFSFFPQTGSMVGRTARAVINAFEGLAYYFYHPTHFSSLSRFMGAVALLLPIALVVSSVGAYRGNRMDRAVLIAIALFLPLMAIVGWLDWRPEQALVAIAFCQILIARMIVAAAALFIWPRPVHAAATVFLGLLLLFQDTRNGAGYYQSFANSQIDRLLHGERPRIEPGFKGTPDLWTELSSLVGRDRKLWSSPNLVGISATLGSGVHFWTAPVPLHVLGMPGAVSGYVKPGPAAVRGVIWGIYAVAPLTENAPFFILYRDDLRKGRDNTSLVALAGLVWPWLKPMQTMLAGTLFRPVRSFATEDFGPVQLLQWDAELFQRNIDRQFVHEDALVQLAQMQWHAPEQFAWYLSRLREGGLDLSGARLDHLLAGEQEPQLMIIRESPQ